MGEYQYFEMNTGDKKFLSPETPQEELSRLENTRFFKVDKIYSTPKKNKWWQFWKKKPEPILLGYEVTYIGENFNGVFKL